MSTYKGKKDVNKWIDMNIFNIHEYSQSRGNEQYQKLTTELKDILSNRRKDIMVHKTTDLKDTVIVNYKKLKYASHFELIIFPKPETIRVK